MPDLYRRKAGEPVEAMQYDGLNGDAVFAWIDAARPGLLGNTRRWTPGYGLSVAMRGLGLLAADPHDWIVCVAGDSGGFSRLSPAEFANNYELVADASGGRRPTGLYQVRGTDAPDSLDEDCLTEAGREYRRNLYGIPDYTRGVVTAEGVFDA